MKALALVALFLVGCGSASSGPVTGSDIPSPATSAGDDSAPGIASPEAGTTLDKDADTKGDSTPGHDSGTRVPDAGGETAAECAARVCGEHAAQCGSLTTAECGGHAVDCGGCTPSYATCGDNGLVNKCGFTCLNVANNGDCARAGFPSNLQVVQACSFPYGNDGTGKTPVQYGCTALSDGTAYWCCP